MTTDVLPFIVGCERSGTTLLRAMLTSPAYPAAEGKQVGADKTPHHVLHLERIASAVPGVKFVHLVRDGRDVALSLAALAGTTLTATAHTLAAGMPVPANRAARERLSWSGLRRRAGTRADLTRDRRGATASRAVRRGR